MLSRVWRASSLSSRLFTRSFSAAPRLRMPNRRPRELNELPIDSLLQQLLLQNQEFAEDFASKEQEHLQSLGKGQSPRILWIGCSDSRVSAELSTGVSPGHIFVLRNIANSYLSHDLSANAVLSFAVFSLKIEAIIVCGHTNCGGIKSALGTVVDEVVNDIYPDLSAYKDNVLHEWVDPIKQIAHKEITETPREDITEENKDLVSRVSHKHVQNTVRKLALSSIVRQARNAGHKIRILGWEYDVETARLRDLGIEG